jgi:hypothetical protein
MDRHDHPRRRRAGWISVIRAEGVSKVFSFREDAARPAKAPPCGSTGALARAGSAARQDLASAEEESVSPFPRTWLATSWSNGITDSPTSDRGGDILARQLPKTREMKS